MGAEGVPKLKLKPKPKREFRGRITNLRKEEGEAVAILGRIDLRKEDGRRYKRKIELRFVNKSFKTQTVLFSEAAICENKFQTIKPSLICDLKRFTGSKQNDATSSKSLAMDGFFIPLCKDIGDQRFSDTGSHASSGPMEFKDNKGVDPGLFNSQGIYPQPPGAPYLAGKKYGTICTFSKSTLSIMHFNSPI
ncbi:hypothetical protein NE237_025138 [Protea cynaroides]|uniref:Uncharacterized protein n=1 Tax=Protea cynaroides TaxID=273540 RepID=A0A9Q0H1C4_9MAGN|nr:hypothetical protein NE237_025138 [Protea cynaroides]